MNCAAVEVLVRFIGIGVGKLCARLICRVWEDEKGGIISKRIIWDAVVVSWKALYTVFDLANKLQRRMSYI